MSTIIDPVADAAKKKKIRNISYGVLGLIVFVILVVGIYYLSKYIKQKKSGLPSGIMEGGVYRCMSKVYLIQDKKKRWFPNDAIYKSYSSPTPKDVECSVLEMIPDGANLPMKN